MSASNSEPRQRKWTPVCEVCHGRPKMDRCDCCEECWYSGRYSEAVRSPLNRADQRAFDLRAADRMTNDPRFAVGGPVDA